MRLITRQSLRGIYDRLMGTSGAIGEFADIA